MTAWSHDQARKTYRSALVEGYCDADAGRRIVVSPRGAHGPTIALPEVIDSALANGANLPVLVRFPDILGDRLAKLQSAFAQAMREWEYAGG